MLGEIIYDCLRFRMTLIYQVFVVTVINTVDKCESYQISLMTQVCPSAPV